jgi:heme oxygenase (biliverdin-IX-beta and delta-forming)
MAAMDADASALLARLIREVRIAALGTLRQGGPLVSMVSFLPEADFGAVCLRLSRLAWHTQDMLADPRVSLSIVESDDGRADPQTLARVTLRGEAQPLAGEGEPYERLKASWLERFPASAVTFALADFSFWRLVPRDARFVAGLGRTYNLSAEALRRAAI